MALSGWVMIATIIILTSKSKWQILVGRVLFCEIDDIECPIQHILKADLDISQTQTSILEWSLR